MHGGPPPPFFTDPSSPGRTRIKPSKFMSLMGMVTGVIMIFIGLVIFGSAMSHNPSLFVFLIMWILVVFIIIIFYAYNYFTAEGISIYDIDSTSTEETNDIAYDFEMNLRKLERLRRDRLISDREYRLKRNEIIRRKW